MKVLLFASLGVGLSVASLASDFYASPIGADSFCTFNSPCSLTYGLGSSSPANNGNTLLLRAGTYFGNFHSSLVNAIVMNYPGERATLDGKDGNGAQAVLIVDAGSGTIFRSNTTGDLEITNSKTPRCTSSFCRPTGFDARVQGTQGINLIIHDNGSGIAAQAAGVTGIEFHGNLDYYNGVNELDHGLYLQAGHKVVDDSILFYNAGRGLQIFGGSVSDGYTVTNNFAFANGQLGVGSGGAQYTIAGGDPLTNLVFTGNAAWSNTGSYATDLGFGTDGTGYTVTGNYIVSSIEINENGGSNVSGNSFLNSDDIWTPPFPSFQSKYPNNTFAHSEPTSGQSVIASKNVSEPGRGNVYVFNYDQSSTVLADLSSFLAIGSSYEIRNATDYFGAPVVVGVYNGGTVSIPMNGLVMSAPVGLLTPPNLAPKIAAFIVRTTFSGPTPTQTSTATQTPTPTWTRTSTRTSTSTATKTATPSSTRTPTRTRTRTATSSPTATATPTPSLYSYFEAESGHVVSPMTVKSDPLAVGGLYVSTVTVNKGNDKFTVTALTAGLTHYAWQRVVCPDQSSDSFFVSLDGEADASHIDDTCEGVPYDSTWRWRRVTDRALGIGATWARVLSAGTHTLRFRGRDANTELDRIAITTDPNWIPSP